MNTKMNLKRPFSLLLAVLLVLSGSIIAVSAEPTASGSCGDNLTWVLENGTLTISGKGEMEKSSYGWEDYKDQITAVVIETGVTGISWDAFSGCTGLTSITIPDSVTRIGVAAFSGCAGLTSITIPDSVTRIGDYAFSGCTGLTSITIPDSVTGIDYGAFRDCTGLTSITIPNSVTYISYGAFSGCTGLTSITIPDNVTSIGEGAFRNTAYYNNERNWEHDVLYIGSNMIEAKDSISGTYHIKEGTSLIADDAFKDCTGLTSITIPDSVTGIGDNAFYGCTGLTSITIPDSVTSIGQYAFRDCTGLTSITIPDSVTGIDYGAFEGCTGLTGITIPDSVTWIGWGAFYGCDNLTIYGKKGSCAETYANANNIPFSPIETGEEPTASGNCGENLTWVLENGTLTISGQGEMKWEQTDDGMNYSWNAYKDQITAVVIETGVTSIGGYAFYNCTDLTSITIPDGVTEINGFAFHNTAYYSNQSNWENDVLYIGSNLINAKQSISGTYRIKEGTSLIADYAFSGCDGLASVTIPDSVTGIGEDAFYGCDNLTIYGKKGSCAETYANANNIPFSPIATGDEPTVSGTCGENLTWVLENGTLTISGQGEMQGEMIDYHPSYGWGDYKDKITAVVIENGVTNIGNSAFDGCAGLTGITIPESVTGIGYDAFAGCTGLTGVTLPDGVTTIGGGAFSDCTGLTSITMPDGVTAIDRYAFSGCTGLTDMTIPDSVRYLGEGAFYKCSGLTSINIPDGVTDIGWFAFSDCTGLTSVTIPGSITVIDRYAFEGCTGLTSITIPDGISGIDDDAFAGCTALASITIPDGVTDIDASAFLGTAYYNNESNWENGVLYLDRYLLEAKTSVSGAYSIKEGTSLIADQAFYECRGLTSVTIPDSVKSIGWFAFDGCTGLNSINIPDSVTGIRDGAFRNTAYYNNESNWENDVLYLNRYLLEAKTSISGTYSIKEGTSLIADYAFSCCAELTSVTIPESVTGIGCYAFEGCAGLTSITIPGSVARIGNHAFLDCIRLASIRIPDGVTQIGSYAFGNTAYYNNESNWENGVLYLNRYLLEAETSISETHNIKEGTSLIADDAFFWCQELAGVTIPDSVTGIGYRAFCRCDNLTIYAMKGAYAETYAKENNIPFKEIGSGKPAVPGDADGDGVLKAADCLRVRRAFFGLIPTTDKILRAVDFNNNGRIDPTDCMRQRRMFFGLI